MKKYIKLITITVTAVIFISIIVLITIKINRNKEITMSSHHSIDETIISQEKIDELINDLGKGKNGDAIDVVEGFDENNNKTYTYITENGKTQTITVRKAEDGEKSGLIDSEDEETPDEGGGDNKPPHIEPEKPTDTDDLGTVYEKFMCMTSVEQSAFYKSFENPEDFYKWFEEAEKEYYKLHPQIVVDEDEVIDFGN